MERKGVTFNNGRSLQLSRVGCLIGVDYLIGILKNKKELLVLLRRVSDQVRLFEK